MHATRAPPANQTVVSPTVIASITSKIASIPSQAKGVIKPLLSYSLLCLAASYIRIPDAMAAFSDSTFPHMGMRIRQSAASAA